MRPVPEKDVYADGEREQARNGEYRDGCDDDMPEFHGRESSYFASAVSIGLAVAHCAS